MNDKYQHNPTEVITPTDSNGNVRRVCVFLAGVKTGQQFYMRCLNCGMPVMTYDDIIQAITFGSDSPNDKAFSERLCSRCKWLYRIIV
jgi:hypothetical protein